MSLLGGVDHRDIGTRALEPRSPRQLLDTARNLAPLGAIVAVALLARALPVLRGGGLFADLGYDDSVYFGSAVASLNGLVPYRDFLFLHPPGIILVLSPFAWIGNLTTPGIGLAAARIAFIVLGAINALLVALITGQRHGRRAAIFAGFFYAAWHGVAGFERTTVLSGPENAFLLIGLLTLEWRGTADQRGISGRRAILAGVFLGLAVTVQLWEVVPLAVIVGWQALRSWRSGGGSWRIPVGIAVGATIAIGVVCLPFLVAAGPQMIRYIGIDQIVRPNLQIPIITRLRYLEGLPPGGITLRHVPDGLVVVAAVAAALVVAYGAWRKASIRIWAFLIAVQTAILLVIPAFYPHYAAWIAPVGSIAIGASAAAIVDELAGRPRLARAAAMAFGLGIAVLLLPNITRVGSRLPVATLNRDVAGARCIAADRPILLIETTALRRDLSGGCQIVFDTTGTSYDLDRGRLRPGAVGPARRGAQAYQLAMGTYYSGSPVTLLDQLPADGLSAVMWSTIRCHFATELQLQQVTVLLSAGLGVGAAPACP